MSMIYCQGCTLLIDSDNDPECFVEENPYYETASTVLCEGCREQYVREDMRIAERQEDG